MPGEPRGKGRPRFGKGRVRTPKKTRDHEGLIAGEAMREWTVRARQRGEAPQPISRTEPVHVSIVAVHKRVDKWKARRHPDGRIWRCSVPDVDNVAKAVLDALQAAGVLEDDCCVVRLSVETWVAARGESAHTEISVWRLG